jgi:hypothetical protein
MTSPQVPSITAAPVVAPRIDSTQWYSGASIALEIHDVAEGIRNGDWVEGGIGALGVAADGVGLIVDPIGTLAGWGVGWAIEHIRPLSDMLDKLTGDPDQVMAYAQTWTNISTVTSSTEYLYEGDLGKDLPSWADAAGNTYRELGMARIDTLNGLTQAAAGMNGLAETLHMVVNGVRSGVRALISFVVGKIISWVIEEGATFGLATPLVITQAVTAIGQTSVKVTKMVTDLMRSLKRLHTALQKYKMLITGLRVAIGTAAGKYSYTPYAD